MSSPVMTVTGPVRADDLGFTLPHEHLLLDLSRTFPAQLLQFDFQFLDEDLIAHELKGFVDAVAQTQFTAGRPCIVELTVEERTGRNPEGLRRLSTRLGIPIVMGCGWYREPWFHADFARQSTNDLADHLTREIEHGVGDTGVRPGIIGEIGADNDVVSPAEERALRASARAHLRTGLSITLHARASRVGMQQLDILEEEGVDLNRVIVGHSDTYPHPDYHEQVAKRGAWVEFDTIRGRHQYVVDRSIRFVLEAVRRGISHRLLLSGDICRLDHLQAYGGTGYGYIPRDFVHELTAHGLDRDLIEQLVVVNPRLALVGTT